MIKPLPTYNSYLLRLWREGDSAAATDSASGSDGGSGRAGIRITLQNVADGTQVHFTDVQRLITFLNDQNGIHGDKDQ